MKLSILLALLTLLTGFFLPAPSIKLKLVARGLSGPVAMGCPKDGTNRLFICEQTGKIKIIKAGVLLEKPFLNISSQLAEVSKIYSEKGLLGIAFHPDYKRNGKFYIYYSAEDADKNFDHKSVLAEYKVSADKDVADPASQKIILEIKEPESNHNGGQLAFGPDGYLYIGLGDGGGAGDEHGTKGNGQELKTLLGKILRIDINSKETYAVPSDNPFVNNKEVKPEIWAYGLRNPWRFSFDRQTGLLFCADVGQNKWEEVDIIKKGKNYGWRIMEGKHCYNPANGCKQTGLELPIAEYNHGVGISITGGYVYRGKTIPALWGKYIFGDWKGKLFYLEETNGTWAFNQLSVDGKDNDIGLNINSFGEDENGELYILTQKTIGTVFSNGYIYLITS